MASRVSLLFTRERERERDSISASSLCYLRDFDETRMEECPAMNGREDIVCRSALAARYMGNGRTIVDRNLSRAAF